MPLSIFHSIRKVLTKCAEIDKIKGKELKTGGMDMKRKFGIVSECLEGVSTKEALPMIKEAGFACYFTNCYKADEVGEFKALGDANLSTHPFAASTPCGCPAWIISKFIAAWRRASKPPQNSVFPR